MAMEASKAALRRLHDPAFMARYFVGHALDLGAGPDGLSKQMHLWPLLKSVRDWDMPDGDAGDLADVAPNSFDVIHASHLLEHVVFPWHALGRWLTVVKPGGYIVCLVPDEDLYEQGVWPSTFNPDHKSTFTMWREEAFGASHRINVLDFVRRPDAECVKVERLEHTWNPHGGRYDRTASVIGESAIEFVLRRRA